jgi:hypothetical protein
MSSKTNFITKLRKQKWSTPTIMTIFIMICMFLIYGMEQVGLANKNKNLLHREHIPERLISYYSKEKKTESIKRTEKTKEEMRNEMMKILSSGIQTSDELEKEFYDC